MIGDPEKPGCVVASMFVGPVIVGSAESGAIVCNPPPPMLKPTVSAPGLALASRIACRNEPAPAFAVVITVKTASN